VKAIRGIALGCLAAVALAACEKEVILQGERLDPREVLAPEAAPAATPVAVALKLPAAQGNAEWTHRAGAPSHALINPAIGAGSTRIWSANIGAASGRKHRITADPVVAGGRVFTLDSHAGVTATATSGATLWQADLTPPGENPESASGGGLAAAGGAVYATTGFGELVALEAATGRVLWRQKFDAGIGGAPTVSGEIVYVVARDASAWAVRTSDGKVLWQLPGTPSGSGMTGVSAPAVNDRLVVFPFPSGELIAALKTGGLTLWQSKVAGARPGRAYTSVLDLTGDPVIVGKVVYAGSSAGKVTAFDVDTGDRIWTAKEGAVSPVQVAGGSVFLVSDENRLVRLDAATGEEIWAIELPYYLKDKIKKQQAIHVHYGPLLAGGKLFLASSDGLLRVYDPTSGNLIGQAEIPGGAATDPVVAGSTLYVVGMNGQLHAFR